MKYPVPVDGYDRTPGKGVGHLFVIDRSGKLLRDVVLGHDIVNEFPFQQWSAAGHVMTRNPLKFAADGSTVTMWAAPDNGEETAGTQIYEFRSAPIA